MALVMDHPAMTWIGWTLALLILAPGAHSWYRTHLLFGRIDGHMIRQMLYLCRFTGHLRVLGLSIAAILCLISIRIFGVPIPSGVMAAMVSVALVPFLRLTTPPAVLFLAGSSNRATNIFWRLNLMVRPLRAVALLDPHRMGPLGKMLRLDLMRTSSENTWKSMIHRLMDIAQVYVADTVHRTGPVRYEAFLLLAPERAMRSVFICGDDGQCPSLEEEGIDPSQYALPVTMAEEMGEAVLRVLEISRALPRKQVTSSSKGLPMVAEDWGSLPSMLMIELTDGLDGGYLIERAQNTDKDLIALLVPFSSVEQEAAKTLMELSWDFSRDPLLAGIYLKSTGVAMVRRQFLLQNVELLDIHVRGLRPGAIALEDLNNPEPVGVAVHDLCVKWREAAAQRGLEFRFARK